MLSEKRAARKAFEQALDRELNETIRKAKDKALAITDASEMWDLERWLTRRRKDIDSKYDYRYSVLPIVFARLLHEGRISEDDLQGLGPEKLALIRDLAGL